MTPFLLWLAAGGCASRNYTHYLIEPAPAVNEALVEEDGTDLRPFGFGSTTALHVRWNDGDVITEVDIPLLASGQRVIVAHTPQTTGVPVIPATRLVPPPPTAADESLDAAYRARGLAVNPEAPEVSLTRARSAMQGALATGNYALALEWASLVLARYPAHPETMRAKGSILVLLGERDAAIEVYEAVEEIESDPAVREQLEALRRGPR